MMLRGPPWRLRTRSARVMDSLVSSTSGLPEKISAKRGATRRLILRSGRWCLRRERAGVVRTVSPRDRRRITAIREPDGKRSSKFTLFFNTGFIDQHHGDVVANGVDPLAFHAFQAVFVLFELHRRFAERADENFQQIFADGHKPLSVPNTTIRAVVCPWFRGPRGGRRGRAGRRRTWGCR